MKRDESVEIYGWFLMNEQTKNYCACLDVIMNSYSEMMINFTHIFIFCFVPSSNLDRIKPNIAAIALSLDQVNINDFPFSQVSHQITLNDYLIKSFVTNYNDDTQ